jgi:hypothetical protein
MGQAPTLTGARFSYRIVQGEEERTTREDRYGI